MRTNRTLRSILVVCFFFVAVPAVAQGDPVAAGLQIGLQKSIGVLASMAYNTNCRPQDLDHPSDNSWYCGVFASLSGEKEKEFRDRMLHNMEKVRGSLANIETGVANIQEQQREIYDQNRIILLRLDEVGPETTIGKNISRIRTIYNEQFARMFRNRQEGGEQPAALDPRRMRALARQIIFTDRVYDLLGTIDDQLVNSQTAGKDPLLRAYAKRAYEQIKNDPANGLEPAYAYIESAVDGLLADQRKGFVLYVWAVETLQADCEVAKYEAAAGTITAADAKSRCEAFDDFPHTANEYRVTFTEHLRAQLRELNAGLEYQVLAASDMHARQPNFLPAVAGRLFARVDLFTAGNLEEDYGVRGRVIAMGDTFDGELSVAGTKYRASGNAVNRVPNRQGRVDWWKITSRPGAYDEVHFSGEWKIYHYRASLPVGTYSIDTPLPYRPQISVSNVTLGTGETETTVPFGSFTAISRAGGGYALLSGEWEHVVKDEIRSRGGLTERWNEYFFDPANLRAGMLYSGELEWKAANAPQDQYVEVNRYSYARSRKHVRYPKGGELTLHGTFGDTYPKVCGDAVCADFIPNQVVSRLLLLSRPVFGGRSADATVRASLVIDDNANSGTNGIVWKKWGTTDTKFEDQVTARKESKRIHLDSKGANIHFGGGVKMNAQTSTTSKTQWWMFGLVFIENAYLTE